MFNEFANSPKCKEVIYTKEPLLATYTRLFMKEINMILRQLTMFCFQKKLINYLHCWECSQRTEVVHFLLVLN